MEPASSTPIVRHTQAEIESLKRQWRNDPCWDLADTDGFEAHRGELAAYEAAYWAEAQQALERKEQAERQAQPAVKVLSCVQIYGSNDSKRRVVRCRRPDLDTAEIVRRYLDGETSYQIADSLGCSKSIVAVRLKRAGVTMRHVGTYKRPPRPPACPRCGSTERRSRGECANCARERDRGRQESVTTRNREWRSRPENKPRTRAYAQRWARDNAARVRMQQRGNQALLRAIADGRVVRQTVCEACGRNDVPIEAAHIDYSRPLDVKWLCRHCHRAWDKAQPKTLADEGSSK